MGCCGDDDAPPQPSPPFFSSPHDLLQPLCSSSSDDTTISPMNSNFSALLCEDTLRAILQKLSLSDLARAACVCRLWQSVASDSQMQIQAFISPWKLQDIVGQPSSSGFWRDNSLSKFAVSHRLSRSDSIASLAVKYTVQIMDIKRLNNMMSDHGIYSRERLLIPVSNPEMLVGSTCYIEVDAHAKREVAVVYLEGGPDRNLNSLLDRLSTERGKKRVIDSLKRSMHVDHGTALYYLSISNGDPRVALTQFSDDVCWERQQDIEILHRAAKYPTRQKPTNLPRGKALVLWLWLRSGITQGKGPTTEEKVPRCEVKGRDRRGNSQGSKRPRHCILHRDT